MSGLFSLTLMATLLGVGTFAVGILPLSFAFSKTTLAWLSSFGTGLLLGTALGVIIPEGVETIAMTNTSRNFPTGTIALSLIGGFSFMLVAEPLIHRISSHSLSTAQRSLLPTSDVTATEEESSNIVFNVELDELQHAEGIAPDGSRSAPTSKDLLAPGAESVAYPLTLGLVIHALSDGFALGSSAVSPVDKSLSMVVFLALLVHKAPTVLALTTSLLATSLPRAECRKHIAMFCASTPIGALLSYALLSLVRINSEGNWTGVSMLISGGTFLYVATVIQPGKAASEELAEKWRMVLLVVGMLIPAMIGIVVGHGD